MSVTEISSREGDFERTPPHDIAAEQCVLGGMLLSKDAISDVLETIQPHDHYRPAHQIVHEVILDLYSRGEPADAVTVAAELTKRGDITRMGGAPYLHTLIASVPTAANAGYYARIVRERAILRRLVEVGTRIVQLGYSGDGDADELLDRAEAEVYKVADRRVAEDYHPLAEIMPGALDEIEAIGSRGGGLTGVPTGFSDLDALTNGLHPGQMIVIAARPALGKALALDTPLPTPGGWTTMGGVQVGEYLLGADGKPTRVVAATEVMHNRPCFELTFDDGTTVIADAEHGWLTDTHASRKSALAVGASWSRQLNQGTFASVKTTSEIAVTVRTGADNRLNHSVDTAGALDLPPAELPIPPYALGVWLGDGTSAAAQFTSADPEVAMHVEAEGLHAPSLGARYRYALRFPDTRDSVAARFCTECGRPFVPTTSEVMTCGRACGMKSVRRGARRTQPTCGRCGEPFTGLTHGFGMCRRCVDRYGSVQAVLRELGVLSDKHIPTTYLRASEDQRRALLAGLLDTDGTVGNTGSVQFGVTSRKLAEDVRELVVSLGYRCGWSERSVRGRTAESSTCFVITFTTSDDVFRLGRKRLVHQERRPVRTTPKTRRRYITAVRQVVSQPVRCVQVDNLDHLYLASRSMIPTHNSTLALDLARACSIKNGLASVIFSLEMGRNEITMRLLSAEARVPLHSMRTGQMGDEDWTRLARRMSEVVEAPLFIDDSPNMSMMEIRAKCRRLKQRQDLKLVIIDYLQLMSSPKRTESRQQEVSEMSRSLKLLAKELEVPVIAVAQLNRGPEQRTDKKPMLSDLRESGCLTQDTRILRADTGTEVTLGELMASGERDILVWSLDEKLHLIPRVMTHAFSSGTKEVFRVQLRSGREVQATANHPFLSFDGWMPLRELQPGSRVAIPRHVPAPADVAELPEPEIILLAQKASRDALVPAQVFSLPSRQVALFLRHLWATDGCVWWDKGNRQARIYYASTSRRLVDDVAQLLLRSGILTRVKETVKAGYRTCYQLHVYGADNQLRFLRSVGVHGGRDAQAQTCLQMLESVKVNTNLDTVPREIWQRVRAALEDQRMSHRQFAAAMGTQFNGSTMWKHAPSRERLGKVATILGDAELDMVATNDVFWDEIASVTSLGEQPVFDATVPGTSNFVANGISLHNSIEQDADMVILLHREDAYERESPRAGEADFIVAKHRNGPTATVTVAFQGHFSRFVDMAPG